MFDTEAGAAEHGGYVATNEGVPDEARHEAGLGAPGEPDLRTLTADELADLGQRVSTEQQARTDRALIAAVRGVLEANTELVPDDDLGPVVKVTFSTWDWADGWFFQESNARVIDAQGRSENYDFSTDEQVADLLVTTSRQASIGEKSTLSIDLTTSTLDIE